MLSAHIQRQKAQRRRKQDSNGYLKLRRTCTTEKEVTITDRGRSIKVLCYWHVSESELVEVLHTTVTSVGRGGRGVTGR